MKKSTLTLALLAATLTLLACGDHTFDYYQEEEPEEAYSSSSSSKGTVNPPNPPTDQSSSSDIARPPNYYDCELYNECSSSSNTVNPPNPISPSSSSSNTVNPPEPPNPISPSSSSSEEEIELPPSSSSTPMCGIQTYDPSTQYCSGSGIKNYSGTFTDPRDGKTYKTIRIGEQLWMAENLKYNTRRSNSSKCYNNLNSNCDTYGRLYDWRDAMQLPTTSTDRSTGSNDIPSGFQGICPAGWHIPSDAEWQILINYIGESAGDKLKSSTLWNGTDDYGFTALPAGNAAAEGTDSSVDGTGVSISGYYSLGTGSYWWTAYDLGYYLTYYRCIDCYGLRDGEVHKFYTQKTDLMSVRCLGD